MSGNDIQYWRELVDKLSGEQVSRLEELERAGQWTTAGMLRTARGMAEDNVTAAVFAHIKPPPDMALRARWQADPGTGRWRRCYEGTCRYVETVSTGSFDVTYVDDVNRGAGVVHEAENVSIGIAVGIEATQFSDGTVQRVVSLDLRCDAPRVHSLVHVDVEDLRLRAGAARRLAAALMEAADEIDKLGPDEA